MGLLGMDAGNRAGVADSSGALLREIVAHLSQNRTLLREEWARRIAEARLLNAMTKDEIFAEATSVHDSYVEALETCTLESPQSYARTCPRASSPGRRDGARPRKSLAYLRRGKSVETG